LDVYYKDGVKEGDYLDAINFPYYFLIFFKGFVEIGILFIYVFLVDTYTDLE
jgi:hypothetical protein